MSEQIHEKSDIEAVQADYDLLNSFFELEAASRDIQSLAEIIEVRFDGLVRPYMGHLPAYLADFFKFALEPNEILNMSGQSILRRGLDETVVIDLKNKNQKISLLKNKNIHQLAIDDARFYQIELSDYLTILAGLKGAERPDNYFGLLESASPELVADFYASLGQNGSKAYTIFADLGNEVATPEIVNSTQKIITTGMAEYIVNENRDSRVETMKITRHHLSPRTNKAPLNTVYSGNFNKYYSQYIAGEVSLIDAHKFYPDEFCITNYAGQDKNLFYDRTSLPPINDYNKLLKLTLEETIKRTKQIYKQT